MLSPKSLQSACTGLVEKYGQKRVVGGLFAVVLLLWYTMNIALTGNIMFEPKVKLPPVCPSKLSFQEFALMPPLEHTCRQYLMIDNGYSTWEKAVIAFGLDAYSPDIYACADPLTALKQENKKCVAYLFGVGQLWNVAILFRDAFGCEVWAYDPDPQPPTPVGVHFEQIGVGAVDGAHEGESTTYNGQVGYRVETLATIMKRNGHDHIDIMRLDIEGAEWELFQNADLNIWHNVRQLLLEVHQGHNQQSKENRELSNNVLNLFKKLGYKAFFATHNCHSPDLTWEVGMIQTANSAFNSNKQNNANNQQSSSSSSSSDFEDDFEQGDTSSTTRAGNLKRPNP